MAFFFFFFFFLLCVTFCLYSLPLGDGLASACDCGTLWTLTFSTKRAVNTNNDLLRNILFSESWSTFVMCTVIKNNLIGNHHFVLTHISLASHFWDIGKQCRPRSDVAERGV